MPINPGIKDGLIPNANLDAMENLSSSDKEHIYSVIKRDIIFQSDLQQKIR